MQTSKLLEEKSNCRKSRRKVQNKTENIFIDMIKYTINKCKSDRIQHNGKKNCVTWVTYEEAFLSPSQKSPGK